MATTAIAMPTAAIQLPRRAVVGEVSRPHAQDEEHEGDDVEELDEVRVLQEASRRSLGALGQALESSPAATAFLASSGFGRFLNISSMRSVTRKPPTTLIVPKAMAITRSSSLRNPSEIPIVMIPPSSTIPWIALVADMSGVCSVFGTFEITSKPTNAASTRIVSSVRRSI